MNTNPILSGKIVPMSENASPTQFGRVTEDGTVYVILTDGEHMVGQIPDATPDEAMAFFTKRYDALEAEISLLETRIKNGAASPDDAKGAINGLQKKIATPNGVGNYAALTARLDALAPALAQAQEAKKAERAAQNAKTAEAKEAMVAEAEKLAAGNDWRGGVNRFRTLLEEWKALPRIDRATDDALWHRFSAARTTYTKRRKTQFAQQNEKRDAAKSAKEQIIAEANELKESTEWGPTTGAFRDLMARWKAAGAASREIDDKLWAEFRGIQDHFFAAKSGTLAEQDKEFQGNLEAKQALLDKAESEILPVTDFAAAKEKFRTFLSQYSALGKVPRDAIRPLDNRVRAIEQAVRGAEEAEWKRTDPEARKRAEDAVAMFEAHIAKLEQQKAAAAAKGDAKKAKDAEQSIATYTTWLDQARQTLADFTR
ncbi:MAG: DUF349 domain-containing protein [Propionibacteriaceae bacterium]